MTNFNDILTEMDQLYQAKNHDYGNSFDKSLDTFGLIASVVRLSDKFNRLVTLTKSEARVANEKLEDTLIDLANYSIMTVMWLRNNDIPSIKKS